MQGPVAIIGGGVAGLTCAIRLAEQGRAVHLYEAAPELGGRTRSHFDKQLNAWVDNGPHLMIGAYTATRRLLHDVGADGHVTWQPSLALPLFDPLRGHFTLAPKAWLPFPVAVLLAVAQMPGHGLASVGGMLHIAKAMKKPVAGSVADWLKSIALPQPLIRDMLEPLCLGTMNETMAQADAASFAHVLRRAFENHDTARLGWFNRPLSEALVAPLRQRAEQLAVVIHTSTRVLGIEQNDDHCLLTLANGSSESCSHAVIALPAHARNRLLGIEDEVATSPITNIHLWFDEKIALPEPLIGGIGSYSQWFFDLSAQMNESDRLSHLCAVVSAEMPDDRERAIASVLKELADLLGGKIPDPVQHKIIIEKHATVVVRNGQQNHSGGRIIDASEAPESGELPATIEVAVLRGEVAAKLLSG